MSCALKTDTLSVSLISNVMERFKKIMREILLWTSITVLCGVMLYTFTSIYMHEGGLVQNILSCMISFVGCASLSTRTSLYKNYL